MPQTDCDWLEIDCRLSADNEWFCFHDDTLERLGSSSSPVSSLTFDELSAVSLSGGERIPSLSQAMAVFAELGLRVNIELKFDGDAITPSAADRYLAHLPKILADPNFNAESLLFSSFHLGCIEGLIARYPELPRAFLSTHYDAKLRLLASKHPGTYLNVSAQGVCTEDVLACNKAQIPLSIYTVNSPEEAQNWLSAGAWAIFTDIPSQMHRHLVAP